MFRGVKYDSTKEQRVEDSSVPENLHTSKLIYFSLQFSMKNDSPNKSLISHHRHRIRKFVEYLTRLIWVYRRKNDNFRASFSIFMLAKKRKISTMTLSFCNFTTLITDIWLLLADCSLDSGLPASKMIGFVSSAARRTLLDIRAGQNAIFSFHWWPDVWTTFCSDNEHIPNDLQITLT